MKNKFSILSVAAMFAVAVVACGPSAEDKAKRDKEVADSMAMQDSIAMELEAQKAMAIADSLAIIEKAKADSLAADSVAKASTKKK